MRRGNDNGAWNENTVGGHESRTRHVIWEIMSECSCGPPAVWRSALALRALERTDVHQGLQKLMWEYLSEYQFETSNLNQPRRRKLHLHP